MKTIMNKSVILSGLTTLALVLSVNAQAKIYKWTDANGQVHYTAQPPVTKKKASKAVNIEDEIRAKAGKYRPPAKNTTAKSDKDGEEKKSEDDLAGPDKKLVKYCDSQRNNLKQLQKNFRNVWIDIKGKKTNLNQEQRREKVAYLKAKIKEDCSDVKASKQSS